MSKFTTKIFRINDAYFERKNPVDFILEHVEIHNSKGNNQYERVPCQQVGASFELSLYIHNSIPKPPPWQRTLLGITNNDIRVKSLRSQYPSFVLFFSNDFECYVVSGGTGHRVVEDVLDSQFGFRIVEKFIDTSQSDMRRLSERVFLGPELASNRFFRADYKFVDEDNFGKYYKELDVFIKKTKLQELGVKTNKTELLVKGASGFEINTQVSFEQLVFRVEKLSKILQTENPPNHPQLNPFKKLTKGELRIPVSNNSNVKEALEQELARRYFLRFEDGNEIDEIYHPKLIEYLNCSEVRIIYKDIKKVVYSSERLTPRSIIGRVLDYFIGITFPTFRNLAEEIRIEIYDDEKGQYLYSSCLKDWFFGESNLPNSNKKYIKFENEWFQYTSQFTSNLDQRLLSIRDQVEIKELKKWSSNIDSSEGMYNDSLAQLHNTLVGDRKFHHNIEVADAIQWSDDSTYIIHIKNGLDDKLRVLQSQIINSAKVVSEFHLNLDSIDFQNYYTLISNQPKEGSGNLPKIDQFKSLFSDRKKINFVFAFATKSKNISSESIFDEIISSKSIIAKIAILHSFYTIRKMNFKFCLAKIIRE